MLSLAAFSKVWLKQLKRRRLKTLSAEKNHISKRDSLVHSDQR